MQERTVFTKQRVYHAQCAKCGANPALCKKCGAATTSVTPNSDWFRGPDCPKELNSQNFDLQNIDYVWFKYRDGWFIILEEKRFGGSFSQAQNDTHKIVDQLLRLGSNTKIPVLTMRGKRAITYNGYYQVVFQNTTPDNSEWIKVNGRMLSRDEYLQFLKTGKLEEPKPQEIP